MDHSGGTVQSKQRVPLGTSMQRQLGQFAPQDTQRLAYAWPGQASADRKQLPRQGIGALPNGRGIRQNASVFQHSPVMHDSGIPQI